MAKFCNKCGTRVDEADSFCNNCGAEIVEKKSRVEPSKPLQVTQTQPKKLYRSKQDRWLAGVCGGLGEYFGIDPILVRIAFIFFALGYGTGIIVYIILAIFVEENPFQ